MNCEQLYLRTPRWCWMLAAGAALIALPGAPLSPRMMDATAQGPADDAPGEQGGDRPNIAEPADKAQNQQEMLLRMIAAQRNAIDNLKSGAGRAKLRLLDDDGAVSMEVDVQVQFEQDRYKLIVTYPPAEQRLHRYHGDRYIAVNDGSATFVSRFSDRIHPAGCEIDVHENGFMGLNRGIPGFKWKPDLLALIAVGRIEEFVKRNPRSSMERAEDGTYIVTAPYGKNYIATFIASPDAGFNITSFRSVDVQQSRLMTEYFVDWKEKGGIWYVSRIEKRAAILDGYSHSIFEYVTFEPNAVVDDSSFTFAALETINRPRIVDRRLPRAEIRDLVLPAKHEVAGDDRESMAAQLEKMPLRYPVRE